MTSLGFNIAPGTTPEDLDARRKLAYLLMQQGSSGDPIRSPWQGLNRIAQSLVGGYDAYDLQKKQQDEKQNASDLLGETLGITGNPASAPGAVPGTPAPLKPAASGPSLFGAPAMPAAPALPDANAAPPAPSSPLAATLAQGSAAAAGRDNPAAPAPVAPAASPTASPAPVAARSRFAPDVDQAIAGAAQKYGVDPNLMRTFAQIESSGNSNARTGSYNGLFQLSPAELAKNGGGDILNPVDNANAAAIKLKAESNDFEQKYGRVPSATDLYLIHQQGAGGYDAHTSNPNAPAWQNMLSTGEGQQKGKGWARAAIWGNVPDDMKAKFGSVDNVSSGDFYKLWDDKVNRIGARFGGGGQSPQGPQAPERLAFNADGTPANDASPAGAPAPAAAVSGAAAGPLGIDPATARAIHKLSMNQYTAPLAAKLLETAISQNAELNKPALADIGYDQYGNPIKGTVNLRTGTGTPLTIAGGAGRPAAPETAADGSPLRGEEALRRYSPMIADKARNILAAREPLPHPSRGDKTALQVAQAVRDADPDYNSNRFGYRQQWENPNGAIGKTRVANNTAIGHMGELSTLVEQLPDSYQGAGAHAVNSIRNWWRGENTDPALSQWSANSKLLADEIVKVAVGSGGAGSIQDREGILSTLDPANGREALKATLAKYVHILASKTNSLANDRNRVMGPGAEGMDVIDEENKPVLAALLKQYQQDPGAPANGGGESGGQGNAGQVQRVSSPEEAMKLPPGTHFITPGGQVKVRP